jgi:class 3 adenylate cyclase
MDIIREPAGASKQLPTGTVTFLFTDIEGSTERWERHRDAMRAAVRRHEEIMEAAIAAHDGYVFKTVGDAFCATFRTAPDAIGAALDAQRALNKEDFSSVDGLKVRMAAHTGLSYERSGDYFGPTVNRVARLLSIGYGGQVLVSGTSSDLAQGELPPRITFRDLGAQRLKDLAQPEQVFQLVAPDLPQDFPPLRSLDALPNNLPLQITSFVGRDEEIAAILKRLEQTRLLTLVGAGGVGKTTPCLASRRRSSRRVRGRCLARRVCAALRSGSRSKRHCRRAWSR